MPSPTSLAVLTRGISLTRRRTLGNAPSLLRKLRHLALARVRQEVSFFTLQSSCGYVVLKSVIPEFYCLSDDCDVIDKFTLQVVWRETINGCKEDGWPDACPPGHSTRGWQPDGCLAIVSYNSYEWWQ